MRKLSEIERELVLAYEWFLILQSERHECKKWLRWYERLEAELIELVGEMFAELTMYKTLRIAAINMGASDERAK